MGTESVGSSSGRVTLLLLLLLEGVVGEAEVVAEEIDSGIE